MSDGIFYAPSNPQVMEMPNPPIGPKDEPMDLPASLDFKEEPMEVQLPPTPPPTTPQVVDLVEDHLEDHKYSAPPHTHLAPHQHARVQSFL